METPPHNSKAGWQALQSHLIAEKNRSITDLFNSDNRRCVSLTFKFGDLLLDISRQHITWQTLKLLFKLAKEHNLHVYIENLLNGNITSRNETAMRGRPSVWHTALRTPPNSDFFLSTQDVTENVQTNLQKMQQLVNRLHKKQWLGCTGKPLRSVIHIGAGGSLFGPRLAHSALDEYTIPAGSDCNVYFISSMDGIEISRLLTTLNPETTLIVVASKSFRTEDALINANLAKEWICRNSTATAESVINNHFVGISARPERMQKWGIAPEHQLRLWDWVGGRFSLCSATSFVVALRIGMKNFRRILEGAHQMDQHFAHAPFTENLPIILGMLDIWNINFRAVETRAVLPYDYRLSALPTYLQQLEMESGGKSLTHSGSSIKIKTAPVVLGALGSEAQHYLSQLLHQGTRKTMCDLTAIASPHKNRGGTPKEARQEWNQSPHSRMLANFLAQTHLLAFGNHGQQPPQAKQTRYYANNGNTPCTVTVLSELTPRSFGQLTAMHEHRIFVQSIIWGINAFDQPAVESGKEAAPSFGVQNGKDHSFCQNHPATVWLRKNIMTADSTN